VRNGVVRRIFKSAVSGIQRKVILASHTSNMILNQSMGKCTLFLCMSCRYVGAADIAPRILNPHTKRRCTVSFTYRLVCCQWNSRVCPLHRTLGGPRNGVDTIEKKNRCCSCREWNQLLHCPVSNETTIVTISRFSIHLKSRDYRINTSCKITKFVCFPYRLLYFVSHHNKTPIIFLYTNRLCS
jgi:hypothetical protein